MAEIVRFPDSSRAHEDAALWLARIDKGLAADERVALGAWLHHDDANRAALLELAELWDGLDVLADLSELFPLEPRAAARTPRPLVPRGVLAGCAAAIVAAAVGLLVYERFTPIDDTPPETVARTEPFATPIGGHASRQLADGSLLVLNTDTEVQIDLSAESRDVYLRRGEAHFTIAHDALRPFRVHVGNRVLEAVGTAFNVYLKSAGSVELTVTEGAVKVAAPAGSSAGGAGPMASAAGATTVGEGELAVLDPAATDPPRITRLEVAAMDIRLAWQRGMLIFQGEPLPQVLDEVSRYTTTEFVLESEQLQGLRVGGYFRASDIDGLLLSLRDSLDIEFERVGTDRVILRTTSAAR